MSKILLAVNEEDIEVLDIGVSIMKAKQDAQELIKQAKLDLTEEILNCCKCIDNRIELITQIEAIKSEIEKE